jgi:protoheme IX farnesyltransferase
MLGWVAATGDFGIEAGTLFLIQFFGNSLILGNWLVLEDYENSFLCCQQAKDKGTALQVILYTGWLIIASLLPSLGYTGRLFISPVAAVVIFFWFWMLFYAVKLYSLRTAKRLKL